MQADINFHPQQFYEDSSYLYFLTDEDHEFKYLKKIDLDTCQSFDVAKENWDITSSFFSNHFHFLVYSINNDARTEMKIINVTTQEQMVISSLSEGQIVNINFSKSEKLISFLLNSSNSPTNLYAGPKQEKIQQGKSGRMKNIPERSARYLK